MKSHTWADTNRPMRVFEKVLQGGLGKGNLGVLMSPHGMGKAAILASITIDQAMSGTKCLHVAYGQSVSDVRAYDDGILDEIVKSLNVADHAEVVSTVERHKQIYTYGTGQFSPQRLRTTLDFLAQHAEFKPGLVEIQGWPDFRVVTIDEIRALKGIAIEYHCELWMTAHTSAKDFVNSEGIPDYLAKNIDLLSVLVALQSQGDAVAIKFLKTHDRVPPGSANLEFDPKSMLVKWR
jgi:hypothetical protein